VRFQHFDRELEVTLRRVDVGKAEIDLSLAHVRSDAPPVGRAKFDEQVRITLGKDSHCALPGDVGCVGRGGDPEIRPVSSIYGRYCEWDIERFFNMLKHFRAIATRYDKLAKTFLAGVQPACATILLK
jgi:hypothetical protein